MSITSQSNEQTNQTIDRTTNTHSHSSHLIPTLFSPLSPFRAPRKLNERPTKQTHSSSHPSIYYLFVRSSVQPSGGRFVHSFYHSPPSKSSFFSIYHITHATPYTLLLNIVKIYTCRNILASLHSWHISMTNGRNANSATSLTVTAPPSPPPHGNFNQMPSHSIHIYRIIST